MVRIPIVFVALALLLAGLAGTHHITSNDAEADPGSLSDQLEALNDLHELSAMTWGAQYDRLRMDARYYWMDWSQDGCSVPGPRILGTKWSALFLPGCLRHDMTWRTLPVIDDDTGLVWNQRNRYVADQQFLADNRESCRETYVVISANNRLLSLCYTAAKGAYGGVRLKYPIDLTSNESQSVSRDDEFIRYPATGQVSCAPTTGRCLPVHFLTLDGRPLAPQNIPYVKTGKTVDLEVERAHLMFPDGPPAPRTTSIRSSFGTYRHIPELYLESDNPVWLSYYGSVGCDFRTGNDHLYIDSEDYRPTRDSRDQYWRDSEISMKFCRDTRSSEKDDALLSLKHRKARYVKQSRDFQAKTSDQVRHYENWEADRCHATQVSVPALIPGSLLSTDCDSTQDHGGYADFYNFYVPQTDDYVLDLMYEHGEKIDPYMYVLKGTATVGRATHSDDDDGEGRDSQIEEELTRGYYTVVVTNSSRSNRTDIGDYVLRIRTEDDCPALEVLGGEAKGDWTVRDCESNRRDDVYSDYYTFRVPGIKSKDVEIDLDSKVANPYLYLISGSTGASGTSFLTNDNNGGPGWDAEIERKLRPGWYTIEVTTYGEHETGSYELTVDVED